MISTQKKKIKVKYFIWHLNIIKQIQFSKLCRKNFGELMYKPRTDIVRGGVKSRN